jgi:hypothetical protein
MNVWLLGIALCLIGGVLAICGQVLPGLYAFMDGRPMIKCGVCIWLAGCVVTIGSLVWSAL